MKLIIIFGLISFTVFAGNLSNLVGGNSSKVTFAGYTTATYNGNLGGFKGYRTKCQLEYPGSRGCMDTEIVKMTDYPWSAPNGSWILSLDQPDTRACGSYIFSISSRTGLAAISSGYINNGYACDQTKVLSCCYE